MKLFHSGARRSVRSTVWTAITVLVVAAVLLVNIAFSALSSRGLWYIDLTSTSSELVEPYALYTPSDEILTLLDSTFADLNATRMNRGEEAVEVEIVFCDDPDNLLTNTYQRLIYISALELQKAFPDTITVSTIDVYKNPSAVQKYKSNAYVTVYPSNIIIASGTEYRRLTPTEFYFRNDANSAPWGTKIEVTLAENIRNVTKAAAPKCVLLTNHGESGYTEAFLSLLDDAGYEVIRDFDLETQELPLDCQLIVSVAPTKDLTGYAQMQSGTATVSEIAKLDAFLDNENSLMVFFNADTPVLPNFEEYLEKWGVCINREVDASGEYTNLLLKDEAGGLSTDGQTMVADYVTAGPGAAVTSSLQSTAYPPKVVFRNATALGTSPLYKTVYVPVDEELGNDVAYSYQTYSADGTYRTAYDVFTAPAGTQAFADGRALTEGTDDSAPSYLLMTIGTEQIKEASTRNGYTTISHNSYVAAFASSDMLADELLDTNAYGNTDLLSTVVHTLGKDSMTAIIENYYEPIPSTEVKAELITTSQKKNVTTWLALLPAVVLFGCGGYVMTKRKHS